MSLKVRLKESELCIGTVHYNSHRQGWIFIPQVFGYVSSRKAWPTADDAIPRWVKHRGCYIEYPEFGS